MKLGIVAAFSALVAAGCERETPVNAEQQNTPASVTVTPVIRVDVADQRERVGQVQAIEDVELRARIEGFLAKRLFDEGSDVQTGDLLFVIEKAPYEAEVARAQAELTSAKAALEKTRLDLKRSQELRVKKTVSQATLDEANALEKQAAADVLARAAELQQAELDLNYTEIRAPVAGRIGRSVYSVGDLVEPDSGALATVAMLDPIYVYWTVGEQVLLNARRAASGRPNQSTATSVTAKLKFADDSIYEHGGAVDFADNRVDPSTGSQTVRAVFDNPDKLLLPGQYVSVLVTVGEEHGALAIPQSAVQEDQSGRFALIVDANNKVVVRRITVSSRQSIYWVVEDGLGEGEFVIYQGVQKVRPGATVDPIILAPQPATAGNVQ